MPRRLITAAFAGALALGALSGCRFQTAADAAFVGDNHYTRADIDQLVSTVKADNPPSDLNLASLPQDFVLESVFRDVAKRYTQEKGYPAPTVDYGAAGQFFQLPASDPYVRVVAEADAYRTLLLGKVKPVQPTDADYHDAFELLQSQQVNAGSEEEVKSQLQQNFAEEMGSGVALRNELTAAMKRYGTAINPVYLPGGYPLAAVPTSSASVVVVQLPLGGSAQVPVRDLAPVVEPTAADDQAQ